MTMACSLMAAMSHSRHPASCLASSTAGSEVCRDGSPCEILDSSDTRSCLMRLIMALSFIRKMGSAAPFVSIRPLTQTFISHCLRDFRSLCKDMTCSGQTAKGSPIQARSTMQSEKRPTRGSDTLSWLRKMYQFFSGGIEAFIRQRCPQKACSRCAEVQRCVRQYPSASGALSILCIGSTRSQDL